ncbi:MAG TPA: choice-of-anchor Q domain-containing protein [Solirubrobacterales bacterium]
MVGSLTITDSVELVGAGADSTVVKRDGFSPVFTIASGTPTPVVVLEGLTVSDGAGGIANGGDLTLRRVSVDHNQRGGAAGIEGSGPVRLDSSFVGFNRPGGIDVTAPVTLLNSTVAWNSGGPGVVGSSVDVASSAVLFNFSQSESGASGVTGASLTVRDSILAGNKNAKGIQNCASPLGVRSLGGNVEDVSSCAVAAGDRPNVDPRIDSLGLYGGTTQVYDLVPGSPAVDFATQCVPADQREMSRPQGAACDSGPYELVPALVPPTLDRAFAMNVGKKLRLGGGAIWVRLTCPVAEISPPCRGKASVADPPLVFSGPHTLQTRPLNGKFAIEPGKTKWVPLRKPRANAKRLPGGPGKWKVYLLVRAEDGAGNQWQFKKMKAPLIGAKPRRG